MDLTTLKYNAKEIFPPLMVGVGMAFGGMATVDGVRSTFRVTEDGYDRSYFTDKSVPVKEKLGIIGKYYWKTGLGMAAAAGCFVGAVSGYSTQMASMAATASYFEKRYAEYKEKNIDLYGKENDKNIEDSIVRDHISQNPPPKRKNDDAYRIYDPVTEQWFEATQKELDHCERDMNRILGKECPVHYGYFLKHFKGVIYDTPLCKSIGWFLDDSYVDYYYYNESFFGRPYFEIQLDPQDTQYGEIYILRCSIEPMLDVGLDADVVKDSQDVHGI